MQGSLAASSLVIGSPLTGLSYSDDNSITGWIMTTIVNFSWITSGWVERKIVSQWYQHVYNYDYVTPYRSIFSTVPLISLIGRTLTNEGISGAAIGAI